MASTDGRYGYRARLRELIDVLTDQVRIYPTITSAYAEHGLA